MDEKLCCIDFCFFEFLLTLKKNKKNVVFSPPAYMVSVLSLVPEKIQLNNKRLKCYKDPEDKLNQ